eukprot:UC1_evm1s2014
MPSSNRKTLPEQLGKRRPNTGTSVIKPLFVTVFVYVPLWLGLLLPSFVLYRGARAIGRVLGLTKRGKNLSDSSSSREGINSTTGDHSSDGLSDPLPALPRTDVTPFGEREFDLILYGATGFTGKLAAEYLAKTYGIQSATDDTTAAAKNGGGEQESRKEGGGGGGKISGGGVVRWAIAGRRKSALEDLRAELSALTGNPALAHDLPIVIADARDSTALASLAGRTRAVATAAGPFILYAPALAEACAAAGTSYADITGETRFVRWSIARLGPLARASGARIVHHCGFDCIPSETCVSLAGEALREASNGTENLATADIALDIRGGASGGTLATIFVLLFGNLPPESRFEFDPLLEDATGARAKVRTRTRWPSVLSWRAHVAQWGTPFLMSGVNFNAVRRSNALRSWGPDLRVTEAEVFPNLAAAFVRLVSLVVVGTALALPPTRWLLRRYVLPKPGQGPSARARQRGYAYFVCHARGDKGTRVRSSIYFPVDAGYQDTARMLVESALVCALEPDAPPIRAGVLTSSALGKPLVNRLVATGCKVEAEVLQA